MLALLVRGPCFKKYCLVQFFPWRFHLWLSLSRLIILWAPAALLCHALLTAPTLCISSILWHYGLSLEGCHSQSWLWSHPQSSPRANIVKAHFPSIITDQESWREQVGHRWDLFNMGHSAEYGIMRVLNILQFSQVYFLMAWKSQKKHST